MSSICGFSFGRNLIKTEYPVLEAITSILPICDKFVFVVGESEDRTRDLIASIDPKIQVIDSKWQELGTGGEVFCIEGQKAMEAATETGCTWGFHLFCDEVYHENDVPKLREACEYWANHHQVKALMVRFRHFVLDYQSVDTWMYRHVARIYRLDGSLKLFEDGCTPKLKDYNGPLNPRLGKHHLGGAVQWAASPRDRKPVTVFHYNWVQTPDMLQAKIEVMEDQYWGHLPKEERHKAAMKKFNQGLGRYSALRNYRGMHPAVMQKRIAAHPPLRRFRIRWLSPRFYLEILKYGVRL